MVIGDSIGNSFLQYVTDLVRISAKQGEQEEFIRSSMVQEFTEKKRTSVQKIKTNSQLLTVAVPWSS